MKTHVFASGLLPSSRILRVLALAEGGSVCRPYPRVDRSSGSGRVGAVVALAADGSSDKNRKRPCFSRRRGAQGRRIRIANDLASLDEEERKWFLHLLRNTIEADREQEGSPSNGPGAGNWVFMQLAHIEPFERSQVFAAWRLDQVEGFRALCLHPHRSLPILCTLLRRGDEAPHYEYNVRLTDAVGVLSALSAVDHLLKHWNPLFFNGRPRGCSHHPLALRLPLTAALILGPLCIAILYVASSIGRLSEALLFRLQYGAFLCSLLFLIFWLIGILSDWRAERRLAAVLATVKP